MKRILLANRGEIVCRIARTARLLGLTTIAMYSDADRNARHVRSADEAYHLGPAPAAESYLNIPKIIALARRIGADAIHPGYGFLSENADFAQACVEAGLIFIGPPAGVIRAMGSKSASKAAMVAAGVPVAPGYHGEDQRIERLSAEAERMGFPLIIKATAGGGGKGMQVVRSGAEVATAIASAQRLARTAFGDDRLLLERYFPRSRHVEVQVFADTHGEVVTLFDRDCSVQRRHQKIIEEAPAPGLRDDVRAAMAAASITAARTVGYVGAGTVEFLLDEAQRFYFMEMNTRLQVEHPVTELVAGVDLVEWQFRVARGEPLPRFPAHGTPRGAAIEARLYAEDPARDYLPSVGRITYLQWPTESDVRVDPGVDAGDDVSPFYDPMLGKVIAWGESRTAAVDRLQRALGGLHITGVATNRALLSSVLADEEFGSAQVATDFLARRRAHLTFEEPAAQADDYLLAALWYTTRSTGADAGPWCDTRGWRLGAPPSASWRFNGREVTVETSGPKSYVARSAGYERSMVLMHRADDALEVELAGTVRRPRIHRDGRWLYLFEPGRQAALHLARTEDALEVATVAQEGSLLTPLPGTVVAVHVAAGEHVARGARLVTVEAMKMEHTLTAPQDGRVVRVVFATGDRVAAGAVLVEIDAEG